MGCCQAVVDLLLLAVQVRQVRKKNALTLRDTSCMLCFPHAIELCMTDTGIHALAVDFLHKPWEASLL
jgi:hypothetical protein